VVIAICAAAGGPAQLLDFLFKSKRTARPSRLRYARAHCRADSDKLKKAWERLAQTAEPEMQPC